MIIEELTEQQKAKARVCRTPEDVIALRHECGNGCPLTRRSGRKRFENGAGNKKPGQNRFRNPAP